MEYVISGYDCAALRYFEQISAIPRASGNEGAVADYIERFAAARGLSCTRDKAHNLLVRKEATKGRESEPVVMLQAHTDMVTEKNGETVHDFSRDGLRLVQKGNVLCADGTTLGADDGFGVAIMLAVLDECESHPALECLFTAAEEIGLCGAMAFDYSQCHARYMINLDSAEERDVIVGCCGGVRSDLRLPIAPLTLSGEGLRLTVSGLSGGHSGEDIHRGRGNALVILQKLLAGLSERMSLRLSEMSGGGKDNAIAREGTALFAVEDIEEAMAYLADACEQIRTECQAPEDAGLSFLLTREPYDTLLSREETKAVLYLLGVESGVLKWRVPHVQAQNSRNVARIVFDEKSVKISLSTRSPQSEVLDQSCADLEKYAARVGATATHRNPYPGWESDEDGALVRAWRNAYAHTVGKELRVTVIHAGLECGVICNGVKGLDAIAIGCDIHDLHSPDECMELDSFVRIMDTLTAFLAAPVE